MNVSEIYTSIQGEGVNMGKPSVFLRLWGCNLSCGYTHTDKGWVPNGGWKCDTTYTWMTRGSDVVDLSVEEVLDVLDTLGLGNNVRHLVVTGGEPLLQATELTQLVRSIRGSTVEVESNATMFPEELPFLVNYWDLSPKLTNSGNAEEYRERVEVIKKWVVLARSGHNVYFKFVVRDPNDVQEVDTYVQRYRIPKGNVLLMPEGTDGQTLTERARWLIPLCAEKGYRYSDRLHIRVFGNVRGV
jgi:7-carboxy-7-deazaguanine synthase